MLPAVGQTAWYSHLRLARLGLLRPTGILPLIQSLYFRALLTCPSISAARVRLSILVSLRDCAGVSNGVCGISKVFCDKPDTALGSHPVATIKAREVNRLRVAAQGSFTS